MAKVLITGGSGLLGSYAATQAAKAGWETWATYSGHPVEIPGCRMVQLDIRDPAQVDKALAEIKPDAVIHSAALVRPDECEVRRRETFEVNVLGTYNVIAASEKIGAHLVHVSTDLVFNGEHNPYKPDDPLSPPNYYGLSKAAAEAAVYAAGVPWAIVRTTTLYGPRMFPNLNSFSDKVIESLRAGKPVDGYVDQYRPQVPVWNVADVLVEVADRRLTGIYHAVCPEVTTRHELAVRVAQVFGLDESLIRPVSQYSMGAAAHRPEKLVLDVTDTARTLNTRLLTFEEGIAELRSRMG